MKKQVKELVASELLITKSKFITFLFPVSSLEQIKEILAKFKEEYKDATHICYSYILDENTFKYYDDGEPSSTAGAPIYQVLNGNELIYTMCVVIRYFGGTKLGVGGLIKAYSNSCLEALNKATIINYENLESYSITTDYPHYDKLDYFLRTNNIEITNKNFDEKITLVIKTNKKSLALLQDTFSYSIKIIKL
jgi:uncharacterized YigZ family protein